MFTDNFFGNTPYHIHNDPSAKHPVIKYRDFIFHKRSCHVIYRDFKICFDR